MEKREELRTLPILENDKLSEGILKKFLDSSEEAWEVLRIIGDIDKDEEGNIVLGPNALVNERGLRRIIIELRALSNKDIGIGFRTPQDIVKTIRYRLSSFVINLKKNMFNWDVKFEDCRTIIGAVENFYNATMYKSYKGHLLHNLGGSIHSTETSRIENKGKGLGIFNRGGGDDD